MLLLLLNVMPPNLLNLLLLLLVLLLVLTVWNVLGVQRGTPSGGTWQGLLTVVYTVSGSTELIAHETVPCASALC